MREIEFGKKEMLQHQISEFVKSVLSMAETEGKLDHINIEISNHNGNLQMDYTLRDRKKAY
ncbi:hypothetical protein [Clostridium formicaceticum]|uniref:Uncharacterized protein n=1 Tax=Clostridium formicaceticum TaxID=1497 RepID=A0AAC9WFZ7_9CLOT|nr:hypothetical protein [Clostridium formicaceticum]AOY76790.1 hypothetical protein BJL90_13565 [Clostridium formicaceticum]ARE87254.1 hypothetical protein CLFO_16530 [Clostridium formicaceticum]